MRKRQNNSVYLLILLGVFFAGSCEKEDDTNANTFTDSRDGTVYKTVTIGTQVWMAENLNYETSSVSWTYDNDSNNAATYGRLYNWETAQNVCPSGWHLPSDDEWTELEVFLIANGYNYDGTTMGNKIGKSLAATSGWGSSNTIGDIGNDQISNNSSGFTALPGGYRSQDGHFYYESMDACFWSSTANHNETAKARRLGYDEGGLGWGGYNKDFGFSVRCIRD